MQIILVEDIAFTCEQPWPLYGQRTMPSMEVRMLPELSANEPGNEVHDGHVNDRIRDVEQEGARWTHFDPDRTFHSPVTIMHSYSSITCTRSFPGLAYKIVPAGHSPTSTTSPSIRTWSTDTDLGGYIPCLSDARVNRLCRR